MASVNDHMADELPVDLKTCFYDAGSRCVKIDTYFEIYESVFEKFKKSDLVLVEVGVLDGGSLQMWQNFFGPTARIVGLEKNPEAAKIRSLGFEILIADQESTDDLKMALDQIGPIDIFIDDGGHTAKGQIISSLVAAKYVKDGGVIIVEDTHSSFASDFGMPHKYSFANWVHQVANLMDQAYLIEKGINSQKLFKNYPVELIEFVSHIKEIRKFRSMTIFEVKHNPVPPKGLDNLKVTSNYVDVRWIGQSKALTMISRLQIFSWWNYSSLGYSRPHSRFLGVLIKEPVSSVIRNFLRPIAFTCKILQRRIRKASNNNLSKSFNRQK
jgi:hypothetical protein